MKERHATLKPTGLRIGLWELSIIVFPILVYLVGDLLFETLGNHTIKLSYGWKAVLPEVEATNRYLFLATYFGLLSICAGIFIYFVVDLQSSLAKQAVFMIAAAGVVMAGILIFSVMLRYNGYSPRTYYFVGKDFFERALGLAELPTFGANATLFDAYKIMVRVAQVFIVATVPAIVLGCISALAFPSDELDHDAEVQVLSFQVRRTKIYLYLGALFLVAFLIELMTWLQLPSFLIPEDRVKQFDQLVRSISTYYGVQYMLLLCSYYIPVSFLLSKRIHELAARSVAASGQPVNERTIRDWEARSGLAVHDLRSYRSLAALMSPLLTGLVGGALAAISGGH